MMTMADKQRARDKVLAKVLAKRFARDLSDIRLSELYELYEMESLALDETAAEFVKREMGEELPAFSWDNLTDDDCEPMGDPIFFFDGPEAA